MLTQTVVQQAQRRYRSPEYKRRLKRPQLGSIVGFAVRVSAHKAPPRRAFTRSRVRDQRDELRALLDEAARLLSEGPRVLHRRAATSGDADAQRAAAERCDQVFPMRERLLLRLSPEHDAVVYYDRVRSAAQRLAERPTSHDDVSAYETACDAFLLTARAALTPQFRRSSGEP